MKLFRLLLVAFSLTTTALAAPLHEVTLTWNESFDATPPCSSTLTNFCISGFTITEPITGLSATVPATGGTDATVFTYNQTPLPAAGSYTYSVVAVETWNGGTLTSLPATVTVVIPKSPITPTNLTGVVN